MGDIKIDFPDSYREQDFIKNDSCFFFFVDRYFLMWKTSLKKRNYVIILNSLMMSCDQEPMYTAVSHLITDHRPTHWWFSLEKLTASFTLFYRQKISSIALMYINTYIFKQLHLFITRPINVLFTCNTIYLMKLHVLGFHLTIKNCWSENNEFE